ncbi:MAG: HypC/HybG/HupF family hydrogenase formation chaperone [candidate division WOR-3 bacterium]
MCLAIPVRITELRGDMAVGEVGGIEREISVLMTPDVRVGDYVIVHAGFALQIVDQEEAKENLRILSEMAQVTEKVRQKARRTRPNRTG